MRGSGASAEHGGITPAPRPRSHPHRRPSSAPWALGWGHKWSPPQAGRAEGCGDKGSCHCRLSRHGPPQPCHPPLVWQAGLRLELLIVLQKSKQSEQGNIKGSVAPCSKGKTNGHNDKLPQDALTQRSWASLLLKLFPKQMFPVCDYYTGKCRTQ